MPSKQNRLSNRRKHDAVSVNRLDLQQFCTNSVPHFTPLGGSRPDSAVVACVVLSLFTAWPGVILPPDVLDTALAALCAPLIVANVSDLQSLEAHFRCPAVSVRLRSIDVSILERLERINAELQHLSTGTSGPVTERRSCSPVIESDGHWLPNRKLTQLARKLGQSSQPNTCTSLAADEIYPRSSVTIQLDESVNALPDTFLRAWQSVTRIDLRRTSINQIGLHFLYHCSRLTSVELPECLSEVGDGFLLGCSQLQRVNLRWTSVNRIGDDFLRGCTQLISVELPNSLSELGECFLMECSNLERVDLRATLVKRIGSSFLGGCSSLTSIELPESLSSIGMLAFSGCRQLERIELQHTALQTIGNLFASRCNGLTKVHLPDTVTEVGSRFLLRRCGQVEIVSGSSAVQAAAAEENT